MLKRIQILNFQSHSKSELEFSPGVNIVVGSSDSGKTAIIRALRWVATNRPSGDSIRSNWGGATNVILETDEGYVRRVKDKTDQYELKLHGKSDLVFKAFGTNVPQEISQFLNLDEVNIQHQFDSSFLLSETPGAVATHFNKVARLDKIDTATSNINGWIRGLKSDVDHLNSDLETEKGKLSQFEHLDTFEAEVGALEVSNAKLNSLKKDVLDIGGVILLSESIERQWDKFAPLLILEVRVDLIIEQIKQSHLLSGQVKVLSDLIGDILSLEIKEGNYAHLIGLEDDVDKILAKIGHRASLLGESVKLKALVGQVVVCGGDVLKSQENALKLEERFHQEMGDVCILCDQPIKKK